MKSFNLDKIRSEIDQIDGQVIALLNQRAECVVQIGEWKHQQGLPIHVPEREHQLLKKLCQSNPGPLSEQAIMMIYEIILKEMRHLQEPPC